MTDTPGRTSGKRARERGLGRGLSALMSDVAPAMAAEDVGETPQRAVAAALSDVPVRAVPTHLLTRNPAQPRLRFDKARLDELAESLRTRGVLQPILVRPLPDSARTRSTGKAEYQIVAGERRYQAALIADLAEVPVIVRELSDRDVLEIGVIENVQRANLNPVEEARAYARLNTEFGRRHEDIATAIGKSRAYVSNAVRLLKLPEDAQDYLLDGKLTAGHARAILASDTPKALTDAIISKGLSVREAENFNRRRDTPPKPQKSPDLRRLEADLEDALGIRADLKPRARGQGVTLKLTFTDSGQAERAISKLMG